MLAWGNKKVAGHVGNLFVKGVADTNAAALDKALEALHAFLSKANESHAARYGLVCTSGGLPLWLNTMLASDKLYS